MGSVVEWSDKKNRSGSWGLTIEVIQSLWDYSKFSIIRFRRTRKKTKAEEYLLEITIKENSNLARDINIQISEAE